MNNNVISILEDFDKSIVNKVPITENMVKDIIITIENNNKAYPIINKNSDGNPFSRKELFNNDILIKDFIKSSNLDGNGYCDEHHDKVIDNLNYHINIYNQNDKVVTGSIYNFLSLIYHYNKNLGYPNSNVWIYKLLENYD